MTNDIQMKAVQRFHLNNYRVVETGEIFRASMEEAPKLTRNNLAVPVSPERGPQEKRSD